MALGKRRDQQQEMWVATTSLPRSPGHVFYRKLNEVFAGAGFDRMAEELCRPHYHSHIGRPSIPPGVYFRMLLVGYFEGLGSQRGIAWRCADSLSLREFLGFQPPSYQCRYENSGLLISAQARSRSIVQPQLLA